MTRLDVATQILCAYVGTGADADPVTMRAALEAADRLIALEASTPPGSLAPKPKKSTDAPLEWTSD